MERISLQTDFKFLLVLFSFATNNKKKRTTFMISSSKPLDNLCGNSALTKVTGYIGPEHVSMLV
jgi:hypothetical protein